MFDHQRMNKKAVPDISDTELQCCRPVGRKSYRQIFSLKTLIIDVGAIGS